MHILEHLFLAGELAERAYLLSDLALEQVTRRPEGASHSIYEELWHLVGYQQSIVDPANPLGDAAGDLFPSAPPESERQWHDLVRLFPSPAAIDDPRSLAGCVVLRPLQPIVLHVGHGAGHTKELER